VAFTGWRIIIDEGKLNKFVGEMLGDPGGASSIAMVRIGDALGLYKALHSDGPMTCAALTNRANVSERYVREWLRHQAASGYLTYDHVAATSWQPSTDAGRVVPMD
jgi:hypothetical protein